MITVLRAGDIQGALTFFAEPSKAQYDQMFNSLGGTNIGLATSNLIGLRLKTVYGSIAEYLVLRQELGGTFAYPVTFMQDAGGMWKIWGF
jgi:hypothetical protein